MLQTYGMCTVWGEPLSQTAQSFMPELMYGVGQNLAKVSDLQFYSVPMDQLIQNLCYMISNYVYLTI